MPKRRIWRLSATTANFSKRAVVMSALSFFNALVLGGFLDFHFCVGFLVFRLSKLVCGNHSLFFGVSCGFNIL